MTTTDVQDPAATPAAEPTAEAPTPEGETQEKPKRRASSSPKRAASTMPGRRGQFKWAAEAVNASSILAATWLEKPPADHPDDGPCKILALFYFRQPDKGREKHQVFQVTRKEDGNITTKRLGEGPDAVDTYRNFYSPVIQDQRHKRREAREKARTGKPKRERKPKTEAPAAEGETPTAAPEDEAAPAL